MAAPEPDSVLATEALSLSGRRIRVAHGVIMAFVFLTVKPLSGLLLRILKGRLAFQAHVIGQLMGLIFGAAGVGLGVWLAIDMGRLGKQHPIIGYVLIGLVLMQTLLGYIHHRIYLKKREKTTWGWLHVWTGRIILILGIIDGGIGLGDADNSNAAIYTYSALAGAEFVVYIVIILITSNQRIQKGLKATKIPSTEEASVDDGA